MKINRFKLSILLFLIFLFAILYMLVDDTNFGGINNIQEMIKDEILKEKIVKEIKETFYNTDNHIVKGTHKEEKLIDDTTKEIKKNIIPKELDTYKVKPSFLQKFFDRLYFSVITGTTLGYGDIYPITNKVKFLSMLQTLSTIMLILI